MNKIAAQNRKAYFNYSIEEEIEAGIMLVGTEIKSIRGSRLNLGDGYVAEKSGELFLLNVAIAPYENATIASHEERRVRKILLHKKEIKKIIGKINIKGYSLIPLKIILNKRGIAKVILGLAKGKKLYDKRESIKKRDEMRSRSRSDNE